LARTPPSAAAARLCGLMMVTLKLGALEAEGGGESQQAASGQGNLGFHS